MEEITPVWTSHYSIGRSILTLDEPEDIKNTAPVSIFSIAKKYDLKEVWLRDTSFTGYISAYKNSKTVPTALRFGLKLKICNDLSEPEEKWKESQSYISIWMKNAAAEKDLIKLSSGLKGGLLDWATLKDKFTQNLRLTIPFYGGFIFNNNFRNKACVPDFGGLEPFFEVQEMLMPFDSLLKELTESFANKNKYGLRKTHNIYYYAREDFEAYQVFRTNSCRQFFSSGDKNTLNAPGIDFFCSDEFCFESYCEKVGRDFKY